jgi:type II secretory pathway component GspD/PulD (secretin)
VKLPIEFVADGSPKVVSRAIEEFARAQGHVTAIVVPWESDATTLSMAVTAVKSDGWAIEHTNLGTILHVTPRISANDFINLKVIPEVSSRGETLKKTVAGTINEADVYDIRTIKTEVMIPSGNTLVLGGLVSDDRVKANTKVPILGDIPVLGWAFRHEDKQQTKKNLMIFITPTIVRDTDFQPTVSEFLKSKPVMFEEEKPTVWDSAKPYDWSKPSESASAAEYRDASK